ncbi:MAG: hypothetical protein IPN86_20685 [Saprospiraceae bacterium]|nr:hypothetical protein [Saprospiraceae bacterium]
MIKFPFIIFALLCGIYNLTAQNIGINNPDPQAALDINGDLRLRTQTLTLPQGISHDVDLTTQKAAGYNFAGGALDGAIISGFDGGIDGRIVTIFNNGNSAIQLFHEAGGSVAANRILTGTGNNATIYQNGSVTMRYDGQKMRWTIVSSNYTDGLSATVNPSSGAWGINGNTGTDNTNYVGTADDEVGLYFKAGGTYSGRLDYAQGNTSFGIGALGNTTFGGGNDNVAFGRQSLNLNSGNFNTAIGSYSMAEATLGNFNIGIGNQVLLENSGNENIGIGREALFNNLSGSRNIAIGNDALKFNTGGTDNIAIGNDAGVLDPYLENATAIGTNAKVAVSNALVLGGTGAYAVNVGIGTENPNENAILELNSSSKGFLPPRMNPLDRDAILSPSIGLMIFNIWSRQPNYYDGYKWKNFNGSDANESLIGMPYKGGRLFDLFGPGEPGYIPGEVHGMIYDTLSNFPQTFSWGCMEVDIPGANSNIDGLQNTLDIVQFCNEETPASLCYNYVANGYTDWYLPAKFEAQNIPDSYYGPRMWTSTEESGIAAYVNRDNSLVYYPPYDQYLEILYVFKDRNSILVGTCNTCYITLPIKIIPVRRF